MNPVVFQYVRKRDAKTDLLAHMVARASRIRARLLDIDRATGRKR